MNEQTKKLGDRFTRILYLMDTSNPDCGIQAVSQLLSACKEAGLIFDRDCKNCPDWKEDKYGMVCIITCDKPFKEIDITQ